GRELHGKVELAACERHGDTVEAHLTGASVDDELASLEHLGGPGARAAEHGTDPGEQLRVDLPLGNVVRSALERTHALDGVGAGRREDDDGHVSIPAPSGLALPQARTELRLAREHDVRSLSLCDVERLRAPPRLDDVEPVRGQVPAQVARLM